MISVIESEQRVLKKDKYCLLAIILLAVWDVISSIIFVTFALYSDKVICLNNKVQKNIDGVWIGFATSYWIYTVIFTIYRVVLCIIDYRKDKSFKLTSDNYFIICIIISYGIVVLWIILIVIAVICNNYSIYFYVSIVYISVQLFKEIVFVCIWIYS